MSEGKFALQSVNQKYISLLFKAAMAAAVVFMMLLPFIKQKPMPVVVVELPPSPIPVVKPEPVKPKPVIVETYVTQHTVVLPDFGAIRDVKTKKKKFFEYMTVHVDAENARLEKQHKWLHGVKAYFVENQAVFEDDKAKLYNLFADYRIKHQALSVEAAINELLKCIDGLPKSLVLMQAANESAWGTSRFARLGLNFFGQWCYQKGCGVVPNGRKAGGEHEVEAFPTVAHSVRSYFKNINTNTAYSLLREIRAQLRENGLPLQAEILATGLILYSERGDHYVKEITQMITYNERFLVDNSVDKAAE
jgi:Bax protein